MRQFLAREKGDIYAHGIEPGTFIMLFQGYAAVPIPLVSERTVQGSECFQIVSRGTKPMWGSAVYQVRENGSLQMIDSHYDSSD